MRKAIASAIFGSMLLTSFAAYGQNDDCADAIAATDGTNAFDNSAATTDGPSDPLCLEYGTDQIENDVWFTYTASCTADITVDVCGLTGVDTRIAVYDGTNCPPPPILACNDDFCGLQSSVSFSATFGNDYLIRIGTYPGSAGGTGSFEISGCGTEPSPTATATATATSTASATATLTATVTATATVTETATATATATVTETPTATATATATPTVTATPTATPTATVTATPTATLVPAGGSCADTSECEPGLVCSNGICSPPPPAPAPATSNLGLVALLMVLCGVGALAFARRFS